MSRPVTVHTRERILQRRRRAKLRRAGKCSWCAEPAIGCLCDGCGQKSREVCEDVPMPEVDSRERVLAELDALAAVDKAVGTGDTLELTRDERGRIRSTVRQLTEQQRLESLLIEMNASRFDGARWLCAMLRVTRAP
ncbi:MAG TPA: hypothetical protein VFQ42_22425 [Mycobacterium sp.]|nr:hypothetical protein [Mycobacterium sp.]